MDGNLQIALKRIAKAKETKAEKLDLAGFGLTEIPKELFELVNLSELDLSNNELSSVSVSIIKLVNLSELDLSNNELSSVPVCIIKLVNLSVLDLSGNQLSNVPDYFYELKKLRVLRLWENKFKTIPEAIYNLENLEELGLLSNELSEISSKISNLSKLTQINLGGNKYNFFPEDILSLKQLKELYIWDNSIAILPEGIEMLVNLEILSIHSNHLKEISESISKLNNLSELDLGNNQLSSVPESITKLSNLTKLDLGSNQLKHVSENIMKLVNLSSLNLSNNQLSSVPESIMKLRNLSNLDLSLNNLNSVPESIMKLRNLSSLNLGNNGLGNIPDSIKNLSKLNKLYLSANELSHIPESITKLGSLTELYLGNNQLSNVPESIIELMHLRELYLRDNPIENPPIEVANNGLPAIKEYFARQKEEGTSKIYEAKLLIVGAGGVGKTSLSEKIKDANYILKPESDDISTEGIDIMEYSFQGKAANDFRLNIWDFGGQSIYHYTHQFFLTKRSLYLLVTDSRKEDEDLNYWLNIQQLLTGNSPVFIIQNEKQGRVKNLKKGEIRERFPNVKGFLQTNLKDNTGLAAIVNRIEAEVQLLPHIGNALPKSWAAIRKKLEDLETDYISLDKYLAICNKHKIVEPQKALILSGYLHDIGVMLHFQDDPILERLVILNNEWGTDAVYKVIDYDKVIDNRGRFTYNDLKAIWYEAQYAGKHLELVTLMEKFKLCYKIPDTEEYIAPARLPVERVKYDWDSRANTQFRYRYKFMPKGILTRFIVEMHHYIKDQELMWNTGVVLEKEDTLAEVVELYGENEIRIRIKGQHPERFRPLIMERIDRINSTFTNLKVEKLIPCNCETCQTDKDNPPHFYTEEELLERRKHNKQEIECKRPPYKDAKVSKMLNDYSMEGNFNVVLVKNAKETIGKGELEKAFDLLNGVKFAGIKQYEDRILALKSRYNKLEGSFNQNSISREHYEMEQAKIIKGLLKELSDLESFFEFAASGRATAYDPYDLEEMRMSQASKKTSSTAPPPNTVVNVNVNTPTTSETPLPESSPKPRTFIHKLLDAVVVVFALMTLYFSYQWVNANTADWEPLTATSSLVMTLVATYANWRNRR